MAAAIGPGDWVERVPPPPDFRAEIDSANIRHSGPRPVLGGIYCVRAVGTYRSLAGERCHGLKLVGIIASIPGHPDAWFAAEGFRPVYRPRADFIESLKQPSPARETEAA